MPQEILRVGIYTRVSTAEQATNGWSVEGQYNDIRAHIGKMSNSRVVRVYRDNGHSGASLERPAIQQMLYQAKIGVFDSLAVWRFDRLSRNNQDFQVILHYLKSNGIKVISVTEPSLDYDNPVGEFTISLLGLLSTLERKVIKSRSRMGQKTRVSKGLHHGGVAPIGYTYSKDSGKLSIDKKSAKIVKMIFKKYIEYQSLRQVSNYLFEMGIPTPTGKPKWKDRVIRFVLERETYRGYYISKDVKVRDKSIQIIDNETFNIVQEILISRRGLSPNSDGRFSKMHMTNIDGKEIDDLIENPYLKQYVKSKIDMPDCPLCNENLRVHKDGGSRTKTGAYIAQYRCTQCKKRFHAPYSSIVSRLYYPDCPRCGEKSKIIATGKEKRYGGKINQCYSCKNCRHWFQVNEENPEFMDAIRKIARSMK